MLPLRENMLEDPTPSPCALPAYFGCGMEGEDEEFEKLLGEIPQAMESPTQLDVLDSTDDASLNSALSHSEEGTYITRSHSIESLHGLFEAFQANPDCECRDATYSTLSDSIMNKNAFVGLHHAYKVFDDEEQTTGFVRSKAAADASLATVFANLELEAGAPMLCKSNIASHHQSEASHKVSSTWVADVSGLESNSKCATHATADGLFLGVPKHGTYGHAHGRYVGLEHIHTLLSQCGEGKNCTNLKSMGLNSGMHQDFGVRVKPNQPFKNQVLTPCTARDEGVANLYLDGKDNWQHNSRTIAYLQAQQLSKMKLLQQGREEEMIGQVLSYWEGYPPGSVGDDYSNGVSGFFAGRDHGYCRPRIGGTFSPISGRYHLQHNPHADNICTCCTHDVYSKGDECSFSQCKPGGAAMNKASSAPFSNDLLKAPSPAFYNEKAQVRILSRKSSRVAAPASTPLMGWCLNNEKDSFLRERGGRNHYSPVVSLEQENSLKPAWGPHKAYLLTDAMQQGPFYSSLAEIEGRIISVAKDQHGCRFLQRKFDEGAVEDVHKIFSEVLDHAVDLMVDPFGNYLIQKLLEVCTDDQRSDLLKSITTKGGLVNVSLNMHGTRAVQKLIETLTSQKQVSIVTASLRSGVVTLIKDLNGNHVIQRCLQHLSNEDNEFIFEAAAYNCVEIATHRHGCCVLQRCIDYSTGVSRQNLIWEIASNSLQLAQDSFGNYVVQYVLELGLQWAIKEVINRMVENYARLSMQKFSSNVVEKCLKLSEEESKALIVQELIDSSQLLQLLQDPYANYVIQSALIVSKGTLHASLVEAIRPHVPSLRNSPYGKRILSRRSLKKV